MAERDSQSKHQTNQSKLSCPRNALLGDLDLVVDLQQIDFRKYHFPSEPVAMSYIYNIGYRSGLVVGSSRLLLLGLQVPKCRLLLRIKFKRLAQVLLDCDRSFSASDTQILDTDTIGTILVDVCAADFS